MMRTELCSGAGATLRVVVGLEAKADPILGRSFFKASLKAGHCSEFYAVPNYYVGQKCIIPKICTQWKTMAHIRNLSHTNQNVKRCFYTEELA
jgi:hypothetical protein